MKFTTFAPQRVWRMLLAFSFLLALALPQFEHLPQAQACVAPVPAAVGDPRATTGEWGAIINWNIFGKHMAMLPNGKVLAWPTGQDAFVWDPVTNTKTAVPANFGDLHCAAQTFLADGRVIVAGGVIVSPHDGITVTAIFDPATNVWSDAQPMHYPRWYGTTTRLADGRILASSGDINANGDRATIPEIYDPTTNSWTLLPNSASKDLGLYPQMFLLPNGKVYKAGTSASTYSLDTNAGTWSNGPTNAFGSSGYAESSAMYGIGKIIRSGGGDPSIANAAIIDMTAATPQWKQIASMNFPRRRHNMVILADGEVMALGGTRSADDLGDGITTGAVYEGEIWNPDTEQWTLTAKMTNDRMYHSAAILLPDGRVLTAGGEYNGRYNAQIFSPPYLFKGARPTIASSPESVGYGAGFNLDVNITDGSTIQSVALIGLNAVTHAFDHNQRYIPLSFSQSDSTLNVVAPANGNIAPPGYYQLVVKDSKGVPSVAKIVRVDSTANLQPGTLTGKVTDANGDPVSGVNVSYAGGSTTTDGNGEYTLTDINPGEILLTFSKSGLATVKKTQPVGGGATVTLNLKMTPPGTITGKVTNSENGQGIGGAIVTYVGGSATTANDGTYTISNVPSGDQTLSASAIGYNSSADQAVVVPANASTTVDIPLVPKPTFVAGEAHDSVTLTVVGDATVKIGPYTTTTDNTGRYLLDVPPGTYEMTVAKPGYKDYVNPSVVVTFGSYTAVDPVMVPINAPTIFNPAADSYVSSAAPTKNYGSDAALRVNSGGTSYTSYMRFNVTGMDTGVQSAKLRLYVTDASAKGGNVYLVSNTYADGLGPWAESGVTLNNAPAVGGTAVVSNTTAAALNTWVEFDVTNAVQDNGIFNFALKTTATDSLRYSSREGTNAPQLVVTPQVIPPPTISSFVPVSGPVGTPVTVSGTNLSRIIAVSFNGTPATISSKNDTQLHVVVPAGASTGKIELAGPNGTASSATNFTITAPAPDLVLSGFSPATGPAGTEVTINGAGFVAVTGVLFNGKPASSVTVDSATKLRAVVPAGATSGKITVVTTTKQTPSAASFVVTSVTTSVSTVFVPISTNKAALTGASAAAQYRALSTDEWQLTVGSKVFLCKLGLE